MNLSRRLLPLGFCLGLTAAAAARATYRIAKAYEDTVRIIGRGRYLARVSIFDHLGAFVRSFRQSFGYRGELDNPARRTPLGLRSFLVWDMRDGLPQGFAPGGISCHHVSPFPPGPRPAPAVPSNQVGKEEA